VPDVPPLSGAAELAEAVRQVFVDGGTLAQAIPAFETRAGQQQMAVAVAATLAEGGTLLVEAGTGTGKTLAYLAPAILTGQRTLVSTGTKNLQEQIFFKDLPILRRALPVAFTATYMKGRGNYVCLHRLETAAQAADQPGRGPSGSDRQILIPLLQQWAAATTTGDRAELEDLPEEWPLWSEIAASSENCLGSTCPRHEDCFVTRLRQQAAASDIVIVNHHLLCADAAVRESAYGEVIPACSQLVIDEAHQLEDVATQYFGLSLSTYRLEELARDTERLLNAGRVADERGELTRAIGLVRERGRAFFGALLALRDAAAGRPGRAQDERFRVTPDAMTDVGEEAAGLTGSLDILEASLHFAKPGDRAGRLIEPLPPAPESVQEDLQALARRAGEVRDELRMLVRADDPDYVYYLETRGRGLFLRSSPIDVSAIVRDHLLDRMRATVLTSATLAVEGSFAYARGRLGLKGARELRLPSEFDFARQAILYLPRRMPDPRSAAFADAAGREIVDILTRTKGRAFVLFTSYAMLRRVQAMAAAVLDYPQLVQGQAPRSMLLRQFRSTPHAVLFATASFWQGVDVIGEALSCVIIDRLPFASPGDPVTAARIEAVASRGGQPFGEYQIPLAILALQQGLGRLIRHRDDRGVLAILDPRLTTMAYGPRFLQALPEAPITHDLEAIDAFLRGPAASSPPELSV
jgi:ATP-dependent DNA helicase DinG